MQLFNLVFYSPILSSMNLLLQYLIFFCHEEYYSSLVISNLQIILQRLSITQSIELTGQLRSLSKLMAKRLIIPINWHLELSRKREYGYCVFTCGNYWF